MMGRTIRETGWFSQAIPVQNHRGWQSAMEELQEVILDIEIADIFSQDGPEQAWLIRDLLYGCNCLEEKPKC